MKTNIEVLINGPIRFEIEIYVDSGHPAVELAWKSPHCTDAFTFDGGDAYEGTDIPDIIIVQMQFATFEEFMIWYNTTTLGIAK